MATLPQISILMPTYNGAAFLAGQIESILDQSLADFELLICDDGSHDGTRALADAAAARDRRVVVVPARDNEGQRRRLEQLAMLARAPLIAVSDQDDIWDTRKLALLHAAMPGRAMAFGMSRLIDGDGRPLGVSIADRIGTPPRDGDRLRYLFRPHVSAHATLMLRALVSPAAFARHAHFDWLLSLDAAFSNGIAFVPDAVVWHRMHRANQANGGFARPDAGRGLKPSRLYARLQARRMQRFRFFQACEHLAFSPRVGASVRAAFERVVALCAGAWFDPGVSRPFINPGLHRRLTQLLLPFAGSTQDAALADTGLRVLTRAPLHPANAGVGATPF